jgi:hypothetical protein
VRTESKVFMLRVVHDLSSGSSGGGKNRMYDRCSSISAPSCPACSRFDIPRGGTANSVAATYREADLAPVFAD